MRNIDIDEIWKQNKSEIRVPKYTRDEIAGLKIRRSRQIFSEVRKSIWTAFSIKSVMLLATLVFSMISFDQPNLRMILITILLILLALLVYEIVLLIDISKLENLNDTIADRINKLAKFFNIQFPVFHILSSFYNPVLIIIGMFYYLWFKYGKVEYAGIDDVLVLIIAAVLSYAVAMAGAKFSTRHLMLDVEEILSMDSADEEFFISQERRRKRLKRRRIIIASLIALLGMVLFILIMLYSI